MPSVAPPAACCVAYLPAPAGAGRGCSFSLLWPILSIAVYGADVVFQSAQLINGVPD